MAKHYLDDKPVPIDPNLWRLMASLGFSVLTFCLHITLHIKKDQQNIS